MNAKPKALLVDDEQAISANLSALLERPGFAVAVASDGKESLRKASSHSEFVAPPPYPSQRPRGTTAVETRFDTVVPLT